MARRIIAVSALALGLGLVAPPAAPPAVAQQQTRICVANQAGYIVRSRLTYTDWQGARHTSAWTTLALGQRQCNLLQDIGSLRIEVEAQQIVTWTPHCAFSYDGAEARRTRTVFVVGTVLSGGCQVEA
jgi:hypothetical protein